MGLVKTVEGNVSFIIDKLHVDEASSNVEFKHNQGKAKATQYQLTPPGSWMAD